MVQLGKLDAFIAERRRWAEYYTRELASLGWLTTPRTPAGCDHAWQAYVCFIDPARAPLERDVIMQRLLERGISTRAGTHAVHMLGYYRAHFGLRPEDFPVARDCDRHTLAIPLHNRMAPEDYEYVVEALRELG